MSDDRKREEPLSDWGWTRRGSDWVSIPVSNKHTHEWTDWFKPIFYRDALGALVGDPGLARLGGTDEPLTDGWVRVCRSCVAEESA